MKALKKIILVMAAAFGLLALNSCSDVTTTAYSLTGKVTFNSTNTYEYNGEIVYLETTKMNDMIHYSIVSDLADPSYALLLSFYEFNKKYYICENYEWEQIGDEKFKVDVQGLGKKEITIKYDNGDSVNPEKYDVKLTKLK